MKRWASSVILGTLLMGLLTPAQALELTSVDLELQSLGADDWVDDRVSMRPGMTFSLSERLDLKAGINVRRRVTQEQWLFGFYTNLSYKPGKRSNEKSTLDTLQRQERSAKPAGILGLLSQPSKEAQAAPTRSLTETDYMGEIVSQNYRQATYWARKAAEYGMAEAQYLLGMMHAGGGGGVSKDRVKAHVWLSLAAAQGNADALEMRVLIAESMTPAQIEEAKQMAQTWQQSYSKMAGR